MELIAVSCLSDYVAKHKELQGHSGFQNLIRYIGGKKQRRNDGLVE